MYFLTVWLAVAFNIEILLIERDDIMDNYEHLSAVC